VYCGDAALCAGQLGHCWLKRGEAAAALDALGAAERARNVAERAVGDQGIGWTSGVLLRTSREELEGAARAERAARLRKPLHMLLSSSGGQLDVGVRPQTGTIELLSPAGPLAQAGTPDFNYLLALEDEEVPLGENRHLDRRSDGHHHLGDFTLRGSLAGGPPLVCSSVAVGQLAAAGEGVGVATASSFSAYVRPSLLDASARVRSGDCPLTATREVTVEPGGGARFKLTLHLPAEASGSFALDDLGLAMPFDQHFAGHTLAQVARQCSFAEPVLGAGGGYVQVTRATGRGPVLLLLPLPDTSFEAWRPMRDGEDALAPGYMYEHTHALMLHSWGYAAREWRGAQPFNPPSRAHVMPGKNVSYGFRLLLAPSLRAVEATLLSAGAPTLAILPGPVLQSDMARACAVISLPPQLRLLNVTAEPAGAVTLGGCEPAGDAGGGARRIRCALGALAAPADGRVRLAFTLGSEGVPPVTIAAQLFITAPAAALLSALGAHGARAAWLPVGAADPWHRDGAFFGWDALRNATASAELRVYMSGLSDEAGAAAGLAMASKQMGLPQADEIAKLEAYVQHTLWQAPGSRRSNFVQSSADYSVRLSQLYWNDQLNDPHSVAGRAATAAAPELARVCRECWPDKCNWMICWSEEKSLEARGPRRRRYSFVTDTVAWPMSPQSWRAYNYPHVTAVVRCPLPPPAPLCA
jgi:hypothetical protein